MIALIAGTNRPQSRTRVVTDALHDILIHKADHEIGQINLEDIAHDIYNEDMYSKESHHEQLSDIQDSVLLESDLWVIVSPEYNGSFPGALKMLIDALSVRKYAETFKGRKVALVGVAAGRAGNLRGMDHLTGLLNYLGMHVYPNKLPVSSIEKQMNGDELGEDAIKTLESWADGVVEY